MSRATAAGLYKTVTLAGKEYKAARWKLEDFAVWEEWIRREYRKRVLEDTAGLSDTVREKLEFEAHSRAASFVFTSPESMQSLSTPAGFIKAWHLGLVKHHPELTEDDVGEFLLHPKTNMRELARLEILGESAPKRKKGGLPRKKAKPPMYRKARS